MAGDNESRRVEFEDFDFNLQQGGIDSVQIISLSMFLGRRYGVQDPTVEILSLKPTVSTIAVIVDVNQSQHNCSENSQTISVQDEVDAQIKSITLTLTTGPLLLGAHVSRVFLTGASRYLGIKILRQLLTLSNCHVYTLTRGSCEEDAQFRLRDGCVQFVP